MSRHGDKKRKKARKARNRDQKAHLLDPVPGAVGRLRWQDGVIRIGKHPDAVWRPQWSGVKVPVDPENLNLERVVRLTALAMEPGDGEVS